MQSFHLIPILCQNSAIKRLKHSPKVSAGKKVPVQSIGLTGIFLKGSLSNAPPFQNVWNRIVVVETLKSTSVCMRYGKKVWENSEEVLSQRERGVKNAQ